MEWPSHTEYRYATKASGGRKPTSKTSTKNDIRREMPNARHQGGKTSSRWRVPSKGRDVMQSRRQYWACASAKLRTQSPTSHKQAPENCLSQHQDQVLEESSQLPCRHVLQSTHTKRQQKSGVDERRHRTTSLNALGVRTPDRVETAVTSDNIPHNTRKRPHSTCTALQKSRAVSHRQTPRKCVGGTADALPGLQFPSRSRSGHSEG